MIAELLLVAAQASSAVPASAVALFNDVCVENREVPEGAQAVQLVDVPAVPKYLLGRMSTAAENLLAEDGRWRFLVLAEQKSVLVIPAHRDGAPLGCTVLWEGSKSQLDGYKMPAGAHSSLLQVLGGKWMAMRAIPLSMSGPVPMSPR